jgi:glycosyltransferase involved in cell wall biosynthesis
MPARLSIVIPAYNEEAFIGTLLDRISAVDLDPLGLDKELIVVDDCSRDRTASIAELHEGVRVFRQPKNGGKGAAVRTGIGIATGEYLLIQDADLEYDPRDYLPMIEALQAGRGDIIYGSRYLKYPDRGVIANLLGGKHAGQSWPAYLGGQSLSFVALLCTGRYLTDTVTAFKLFRRECISGMELKCQSGTVVPEFVCKAWVDGARIYIGETEHRPRLAGAPVWVERKWYMPIALPRLDIILANVRDILFLRKEILAYQRTQPSRAVTH